MRLFDKKSGERLEGIIEAVTKEDLEKIKKSGLYIFDWHQEQIGDLYKIRVKGDQVIIGLISLSDLPTEFRIHINLIESSEPNRGRNKKIQNISGCLISYACKIAFIKGYDGFVSLVPKTKLVQHYKETYGFVQVGNQLAVFMEKSKDLMSKYLKDEEI